MHTPAKGSRRGFLLAIAAGTAAAAIGSRDSQKTTSPTRAKDESSGRGYQLTAHVRKYYRTAQV